MDRLHLINISSTRSYQAMYNDFEWELRLRLVKAREAKKCKPCRKEYPYSRKLYCWIPTRCYRGPSKIYSAYERICQSSWGNVSLIKFQDPHFYGDCGSKQFFLSCLRPTRSNANSDDTKSDSRRFSYIHFLRLLNYFWEQTSSFLVCCWTS